MQVTKLTLHSPEARFNDPQFSARAYKSDLDSISHKLSRILGMSLDDLTSGKVPLSQTLKGSLRRGTGIYFPFLSPPSLGGLTCSPKYPLG